MIFWTISLTLVLLAFNMIYCFMKIQSDIVNGLTGEGVMGALGLLGLLSAITLAALAMSALA